MIINHIPSIQSSLRNVSSEFDIKFKTNKHGFNDNEFQMKQRY